MKYCPKCDKVKNLDDFHKRKISKDGLCSKCKECSIKVASDHYQENSEKVKKRNKENRIVFKKENTLKLLAGELDTLDDVKKCTICKETKLILAFHKDLNRKGGFSNKCAPCGSKKACLWAKKNPKKMNERSRKYTKENPHKHCATQAKRRSKKLQRTPPWLNKEHLANIEKFYLFARLLTLLTGISYVVDHIIPLQGENVSGLHLPWNLQIMTRTQNSSKSNRF
jgi:hypothetical protein